MLLDFLLARPATVDGLLSGCFWRLTGRYLLAIAWDWLGCLALLPAVTRPATAAETCELGQLRISAGQHEPLLEGKLIQCSQHHRPINKLTLL